MRVVTNVHLGYQDNNHVPFYTKRSPVTLFDLLISCRDRALLRDVNSVQEFT